MDDHISKMLQGPVYGFTLSIIYINLRRSRDGTLFVYLLPSFHSLWAAVTLSTYTHYIMKVYIERNNMPVELIRFRKTYRLIHVYDCEARGFPNHSMFTAYSLDGSNWP